MSFGLPMVASVSWMLIQETNDCSEDTIKLVLWKTKRRQLNVLSDINARCFPLDV
ncbi:MAG: hypothetical protein WBD20_28115 [Pirellulaceae bacterium]